MFKKTSVRNLLLVAIWLILAGIVMYFMNSLVNPNSADKLSQTSEVVLQRDLSGHYRAEAYINGIKTPVMVDTGATDVAISQTLADKLGIHSTNAVQMHTANGNTVSYLTRLQSVQLGGIIVHDVSASITQNLGDEMLLGMSFLGRLDVRLYKNTMTIRAVAE